MNDNEITYNDENEDHGDTMPTNKYPGNWFYHVTAKTLMDRVQMDGDNPSELLPPTNLERMAQHFNGKPDCVFIIGLLTEWLNIQMGDHIGLGDLTDYVAALTTAMETLEHRSQKLSRRKTLLDNQINSQKGLSDWFKDAAIKLMNNERQKSVYIDALDREISVRVNPGKLVPSLEPTAEQARIWGEMLVKTKYAWDINGVKKAVLEGALDHKWIEEMGFEYVKSQSLVIKDHSIAF
jgi:hypothetical protein